METFRGKVDTTSDALLLFESCRLGQLKRVSRRLTENERSTHVKSGAVFVWDEDESGIKRWTDGKNWSPSRIHNSFLLYREIEPRQRPPPKAPGEASTVAADFVLKEKGLVKKALSISTADSKRQHLVSYYYKDETQEESPLKTPSSLPQFKDISIPNEMYPEFVPDGQAGSFGMLPREHIRTPAYANNHLDLYGRGMMSMPQSAPMIPYGGYGSMGMYGQAQSAAPFQEPSSWMSRPSGVYDAMSAAYFQGMPQQSSTSFDPRLSASTYASSYGFYGMDAPKQPSRSDFGYQNFSATTLQPYGSPAAGQLNQPPVYSPQRLPQRLPQQQFVPPNQLFSPPQPPRGSTLKSDALANEGGQPNLFEM